MTGITESFQKSAEQRLEGIYQRLRTISEGQDIVDFLIDNNVEIRFQKNGVSYASGAVIIREIKDAKYIYDAYIIKLNEDLSDDNLLQALVHETQHLRHHHHGIGNPDFWPDDEDHCLIRRVQEADAQTATTRAVYMLKLNGDEGPYNEVMATDYAPMLEIFEKTCNDDPQTLYDGRAKRAAFDSWFESDYQKRYYDRDTVLHQVSFLKAQLWNNENHGIYPAKLSENWITRFGDLSRTNYMRLDGYPEITSDKYRADIHKNLSIEPKPLAAPEPKI